MNNKIQLENKLKHLPDKPGVYLMKDQDDKVIYVGKALVLKNRVRSYFQNFSRQSPKVQALVAKIHNLEYMITDSEVEALILECNLIKKYRPKYNVSLKDDKSYPYLKITLAEEFPRVFVTRNVKKDGSRYFGPYTQVGAVHETLKLLRSIFPLRTCKQEKLNYSSRPCLNSHINKCLAPCSGKLSQDNYGSMIKEIVLFLEGRQSELIKSLQYKMNEAAGNLNFEQAAKLRDQLQAVERVMEKQKVISEQQEDQDVVAMARGYNRCCVMVFYIRGGKLLGKNHFFLKETDDLSREEVLAAFVKQYYSQIDFVPPIILLEAEPADHQLLEEWLSVTKGGKVRLKVPKRGEKLRLVEMVGQNALLAIEEANRANLVAGVPGSNEEIEAQINKAQEALTGLTEKLGLAKTPKRIECYDISNTQGNQSVGSMVVFVDGLPSNKDYRRFTIKTVIGPNDFASMAEVLNRRFSRANAELAAMQAGEISLEEAKFLPLPDLVIIDGGKGQLSSARSIMKELGFDGITTFGLAKREEELFQEGAKEAIILPVDSAALYLIQRIRDEAHRFAPTFHRQLRGKEGLRSSLDQIPGIGKERRKRLIKQFGSVAKIKEASLEELLKTPGINKKVAEEIYNFYQKKQ
ncbi:MAG: excinuclease ABC subunit UvrC [Bacillota bacterium]|nr:excinuclease ABC subunit UvrC [Bacillota bacterium]